MEMNYVDYFHTMEGKITVNMNNVNFIMPNEAEGGAVINFANGKSYNVFETREEILRTIISKQ